MKEQTLAELWRSLDATTRASLLQVVAAELFVGADTFGAWRRGRRPIPRTKQPCLEAIVEKKYGVKLKIA